MAAVETIANAGKTFTAQAYDPATNDPSGDPVGSIQDSAVATRYRFSLIGTGIKFVVLTATNLRVAGYVDLGNPGANGYCPIFDSYFAAKAIAKINLIGTGSATVSSPVTPTGSLNPIVIGDDYLIANARSFTWTVPKPAGFVLSESVAYFGGAFDGCQKWKVSGTITESGSNLILEFELPKDKTRNLSAANYDWSVAVHDGDGIEITSILSGDKGAVKLVRKFTN